jgi:drug/metabolite transporter (DMT)-like permease
MTFSKPPSAPKSASLGIGLCILATAIFGLQDALTKLLANAVPLGQFMTVRLGAFAFFMIVYAAWQGELFAAMRARAPAVQFGRALVLLGDIACFTIALRYLGLADMHAIFATAPLIVTILSVPLLGEAVGWRRRTAVAIGFLGALLIIGPHFALNNVGMIFAIGATVCWAFYSILTRLASRRDSFMTSTLSTAVLTALIVTPFGLASWQPVDSRSWLLMAGISMTSIAGHMLFIKALEFTAPVVLQPFTYLMLVWATLYGALLFNVTPSLLTIVGAVIVVASGLYVAWREWVLLRQRSAGA